MRMFAKWMIAAALGAGGLCVGIEAAAAADVPVAPGQAPPPEYYPPQQGYYPPQQGYYPAPVYPAPPPAYYYAPPVVAVVPPPFYGRPWPYSRVYYGPRWYGPRFAHGYHGRYRHW